jgi:hypothetical protein
MYKISYNKFWKDFDEQDNFFTNLLRKYYNIELVHKNPNIIIESCFNNNKKIIHRLNVRKIFYSGEKNGIKNNYDFNFTFDNNTSKNIRLPLWVINYKNNTNINYKVDFEKNKFCCFVASNSVKFRNDFCKLLSKYKKVDCGGKCLKNIDYDVRDKISFQKKYKFCIVFENFSKDNYVTEKILDSYRSNCLPIYWGAKNIEIDFNPKTFINAHDFDNLQDLINYIKKVDNDDELYNSYFKENIFSNYWKNILYDKDELFFKNIAKKILNL